MMRPAALLMAALMLALPLSALASEDDFEYAAKDDGTAVITAYTGDDDEVDVPDTLGGMTVTAVGDYAFDPRGTFTSVSLPGTVRTIGDHAFARCTALETVELPAGLESIGTGAFSGCLSLKELDIPSGVTELPEELCGGCTSLEKVTLPAGLERVGTLAFCGCSALDDIALPSGLIYIGEYAFARCTKLEALTVPGACDVGANAFLGSEQLTLTVSEGSSAHARALEDGCGFQFDK